jgi:vacuolar-type H+-ATPase subunit I/STV1
MLLRICLIVALLGGLAAGVVNFTIVQKTVTDLVDQRDTEKKAKEAAQKELAQKKKDLAATTAKLEATTKELTQTRNDLDVANGNVDALTKKANELTDRLKKTQDDRDKLETELSKWTQLNVTPQQVVQVIADLKKTQVQRDGVIAENKVLFKKWKDTKDELDTIVGTNNEVAVLPPGLKGKIVDVDPKYNFVVLDIGDDKGVLAKGVMMVARDGELIAKVRIARVDKNQSIATLIPGWTRKEVMEGDEVLY